VTKKLLIVTMVCASSLSLWWALAQNAPATLAGFFPSGALVYLEAKDFGSLLSDWNGSAEKTSWVKSSNHEVFSRSRLYLKLKDARDEFAKAAGVPPDDVLLSSVAGGNSSLAIYNIGKLEFLCITRLPSARALSTALWRARSTYQMRRAGNVDYYIKEDKVSRRVAAVAYTGDMLLLATSEEQLAGALELIARLPRPSLASEAWFADAVQAAPAGDRDLRLVYNVDRLAATPHFRSYWIQRNTAALQEFRSGLADLERARGEVRERRVLLRALPTADISATETAAGQLLALVPADAGFYRVWANPDAARAAGWIEEKLFSGVAGAPRRIQAPGTDRVSDAGSALDLEETIDQPPIVDDRSAQAFTALRERLSAVKLNAMLEVSSTRVDPDQVFVRPQAALVLLASTPWNAAQIQAALTTAVNGLWTNAGLGASWRTGANGTQVLDSLGAVVLAVDGPRLILGDSREMVGAILARRTQAAVAGAIYEASWRHGRELPNFERMTRLIDFPGTARKPDDGDDNVGHEPSFYSENIASLGRSLARVDSATLTVHDTGAMLRETAVYRLRP